MPIVGAINWYTVVGVLTALGLLLTAIYFAIGRNSDRRAAKQVDRHINESKRTADGVERLIDLVDSGGHNEPLRPAGRDVAPPAAATHPLDGADVPSPQPKSATKRAELEATKRKRRRIELVKDGPFHITTEAKPHGWYRNKLQYDPIHSLDAINVSVRYDSRQQPQLPSEPALLAVERVRPNGGFMFKFVSILGSEMPDNVHVVITYQLEGDADSIFSQRHVLHL